MEFENINFKSKFEEFIFYFDVIAHEFGEENFIERYKHFNELVTPLENEINETILNLNSKEHISFYLDKLTSELLGRISLYFWKFDSLKKETESEKSTENNYKIRVFYLSLSSVKMVLDTLKRKFYLNNLDFEKVATQIISNKEFNKINELLYPKNNNTQNAELLEPEPPINNEPEPPNGKLTAGQKYYLLEKLGLFENGILKGDKVIIADKQMIVAKLLGVHIRTARAFMNGDEKYINDPNKKNEIDKLLKKITKSKD